MNRLGGAIIDIPVLVIIAGSIIDLIPTTSPTIPDISINDNKTIGLMGFTGLVSIGCGYSSGPNLVCGDPSGGLSIDV